MSAAVGVVASVRWHAYVREVERRAEDAERMVLSPTTAKTHVSRAMTKLGARVPSSSSSLTSRRW